MPTITTRRLTQLLPEEVYVAPSPDLAIEDPLWSPAYVQAPEENPAGAYASYWKSHARVIELGYRRTYITILRR